MVNGSAHTTQYQTRVTHLNTQSQCTCVHLSHHTLTPAWQDSLSTTQFGAQFTITEYSKRKQFDNYYISPPFTTSPQGYRLCLRVDTPTGTHTLVVRAATCHTGVLIMKGQHDTHTHSSGLSLVPSSLSSSTGWRTRDTTRGHSHLVRTVIELLKESMEIVLSVIHSSSPCPLSTHPLTHNTFTRTVFA